MKLQGFGKEFEEIIEFDYSSGNRNFIEIKGLGKIEVGLRNKEAIYIPKEAEWNLNRYLANIENILMYL